MLDTILLEQLRKLNQINVKGQAHDYTDANLRAAVDALTDIPFDGVVKNKRASVRLAHAGQVAGTEHRWQQEKLPRSNTSIGTRRGTTSSMLPMNSRLSVLASHETRRPDNVLFVNGIPACGD